ncbi:MAG TPA: 1-acyl-sn-glycerol-3-phosphate acyltransferase, partial [Rhodocyclaceae bacterium]
IRIVGAGGRVLAERRVGRIQFRGPSATQGYFENPAATAALFDGDWLNTGDLGYLADGELFVTGREKDLIIRGGHNVYPQELEEAVGRIDGVRAGNVAVFPATDRQLGTEALVVLAETREAAEAHEGIRAQVEQLAVDLTGLPPDDVVLAPPGTVLKTSSGKLRRTACRAAYERGELLRRPRSVRRQMLTLGLGALRTRLRGGLRSLAGTLWPLWAWTVFSLLAPPVWLTIIAAPAVCQRRAVARAGARLALLATGISPRVEGLEHLAGDAPAVIVANHASYLDGLLLTAVLPPRFAFVAKQELLGHPLSGTPLRRLGAAFVERFDAARGIEDTQAIEARLAAGDSLAFFAEGTFRRAPGLLPFRMGAFVLAARTRTAVVPVTLRGTRRVLPDTNRWPRFAALSVTIHAPIRPAGSDWEAALALRDGARRVILAQVGEADAGV